jgi:hypothetical protein
MLKKILKYAKMAKCQKKKIEKKSKIRNFEKLVKNAKKKHDKNLKNSNQRIVQFFSNFF